MRVYLAGPMRGYPCCNFHEFDRVTASLRDGGHVVVSPAELDRVDLGWPRCPTVDLLESFDLHDAMRRDFAAILSVEAVVLLKGWRASHGTAQELSVAHAIGLPVFEFVDRPNGWLLLPLVYAAEVAP